MAHYAAVKERLVAGVPQGGTAIVGVDDDWCRQIAARLEDAGKSVVRISVRQELSDGHLRLAAGASCARTAWTPHRLPSSAASARCAALHNAQNAACATAAALALGLDPAAIQAGLRSFPGLAHRMEEVGRRGRVLFVNDSKATNADSAAQALACFADIFWIAGGKPKTGGIESLRGFFPRIRKAYLIGEAAEEFAATLGAGVPHEIAGTLDKARGRGQRAMPKLRRAAEPVVLLSPACASFDQYRNFEVRGDAFRDLVRALPGLTTI